MTREEIEFYGQKSTTLESQQEKLLSGYKDLLEKYKQERYAYSKKFEEANIDDNKEGANAYVVILKLFDERISILEDIISGEDAITGRDLSAQLEKVDQKIIALVSGAVPPKEKLH